ncbi:MULTISPECIES: DUF4153 domain-containing protein [Nocardiopsis]|uniref:DUF4153 domain-containing protein n=1 Tax=Nocardiopsis TaxID=2013 RepID=UPI0022A99E31|nr:MULTISPECIES: DUF4153 domain-containing protein [Nocardiopsis]
MSENETATGSGEPPTRGSAPEPPRPSGPSGPPGAFGPPPGPPSPHQYDPRRHGPHQYGPPPGHLPYAQQYQQMYHQPPRSRVPLPRAPAWLPVAVLGVGVVAALLATFDRPGIGLVVTGVVAGLTAFAALVVRPAIPESGVEEGREQESGGSGAGDGRALPATVESGPAERAEDGGAPRPGEASDDAEAGTEAGTGSEAAGDGGRSEDDSVSGEAPDGASRGEPKAEAAAHGDGGSTGTASSGPVETGGAGTGEPTGAAESGTASSGSTGVPPLWSTDTAPAPGPDRYSYTWSAVYGVLAAALLCTAALRDAGWVLVWTLTASFLLASLAFAVRNPASRQGAVGVLTGALALLRNLPSTPRFLTGPLRGARFRHLVGPVVLTVLSTVVLLFVFGLLFAFADAVFAGYLDRILSGLFLGPEAFNPIGDLFAMVVAALFTGSAVLAARRRHAPRLVPHPGPAVTDSDRTPLPVWVWTIPLSALVLLFTAFLAVQAVAMFGGEDHVQRVAGVTYAEYARQGFFQLVVVSVLVLCVIAVAVRVLPSRPTATRTLRNALLGLLCVLTLVILASAMMRLQLYIDVFGLTRMRAGAEAWILWSAGVFGLVVAAGILNTLGRSAAWLPRAAVALSGVALAVFAYGNPDLRIAESHHDLDLAVVDTWYLRDLSTDAIPGLMGLEGDDRDCALLGFQDRVEDLEDTDLASWNLSRHLGYRQLDELGLFDVGGQAHLDCSPEFDTAPEPRPRDDY